MTAVSKAPTNEVAKTDTPQLSPSARFTEMVVREMAGVGIMKPTEFQKKLAQNYFVKLDSQLKDLEQKRQGKSADYQEEIPYSWQTVNMAKLAQDVAAFTSIGLDPMLKNHVSLIPYANGVTKVYDIGFLDGYVGKELKVKKFGYDVPDMFVHELVYENDTFELFKKSAKNKIEDYNFEITTPFDRGELVGAFYAHIWFDKPEKNTVVAWNRAQIEKRKPKKAATEFWGGTKKQKVWVDNPKQAGKKMQVEQEVIIEGWFDEMCLKTIKRASYEAIAIDSEKINEAYMRISQTESEYDNIPDNNIINSPVERTKQLIEEKANKDEIHFEDANVVNETPGDDKSTDEGGVPYGMGIPVEDKPINEADSQKSALQPNTDFDKANEPEAEQEEPPAPSFGKGLFGTDAPNA